MVTNDLVSDCLTRIRNAISVGKNTVVVLRSNFVMSILDILKRHNKIEDFAVIDDKQIEVKLRYVRGVSAITELKRVSKPGVRIYVKVKDIKPVYNGKGIAVISTPKGLMTGDEAVKNRVGGEYVCYVF